MGKLAGGKVGEPSDTAALIRRVVAEQGTKHLLEVNHIPNVTRFPEIWEAYRDFVVEWVQASR